MRDPRFRRELWVRTGMTAIVVAVIYFMLDADPWVWLVPVGIAALITAKWLVRPKDIDEDDSLM